MKVDVTQVIKDYDGNDYEIVIQDVDEHGTVMTKKEKVVLRSRIRTIVNSQDQNNLLTEKDKDLIFPICSKIYASDMVEFTDEERVFIKKRMKIFGTALEYGRICELFDGSDKEKKEDKKK